MAITITLDAVDGSALDLEVVSGSGTIVRGGYADGIDGGDASSALAQVYAAVLAIVPAGTFYPGTTLPFMRLVVRASSAGSANLQLYYTRPGSNVSSAFIISTRAYLVTVQTNLVLATGDQLFVDWTDPDSGVSAPRDTVRDTAEIAMREVTVNGITFGTPDYEKYEGSVGYVNADRWRNRNAGFWKLSDGGVDASPFTGSFGWHLSAVTRNIIDWSEARDRKQVGTNITLPVKQADRQTIAAAPYKQGIIAKVNGRIRYGQFPMTPFATLFGWGGDSTGHQIPDTRSPIAPPDTSGVASNT